MLITKHLKEFISLMLKKLGKKSSLPQELLLQLKTQKTLLLFALDHMVKEPLLSSLNTLIPFQPHLQDGLLVH